MQASRDNVAGVPLQDSLASCAMWRHFIVGAEINMRLVSQISIMEGIHSSGRWEEVEGLGGGHVTVLFVQSQCKALHKRPVIELSLPGELTETIHNGRETSVFCLHQESESDISSYLFSGQ